MVEEAQTAGREISRRMASERASRRAFVGGAALLFAASAAVTIVWCASMSAMGERRRAGFSRQRRQRNPRG